MKTRLTSFSLTTLAALSLSLTGCSKKAEPAPIAPTPAPAATAPDPAKAIADAAQAKIEATKKEAEVLKAQAEASAATAKAKAAELQAQAEQKVADLKAQATSAKNSLLTSASSAATNATPSTATSATPATTSLQSLTPANFSAWYDKASAESSGIITSLASKAAELGSQASPQFKSLYDTALVQKKTFDDVSAQLKTGGITQWASLYPKLQTSWTDLSKSLTEAKTLLAQFSK
jgi:outer membrane biosynthesis protein TonB